MNKKELIAEKIRQLQKRREFVELQSKSFAEIQKEANQQLPVSINRRRKTGPNARREPVKPVFKDNYHLSIPTWFPNKKTADISIIIPLYKSGQAIADQIRNWDVEDGFNKEIIYVEDGCPESSSQNVIRSWMKLRDRWVNNGATHLFENIGQIVSITHNSGFAHACNMGAKSATGNILIFLHADTIVTPNWIKPLIDVLQYNDVGIVGNLQLKLDGSIDSAGLEWVNELKTFEHIGRNIYKGKRLSKPIFYNEAPKDLLEIQERQMVSGCCFAIRENVFTSIGGFDPEYRIAYWDDADLNMEIRSLGLKVMYQPNSIVYHKSEHSNINQHSFICQNMEKFQQKWIQTGEINKLKGIS